MPRTRLALQHEVLSLGRQRIARYWVLALMATTACGPHVTLPAVPVHLADVAGAADASLARQLAPVLFVQRDEPFALRRVVAVVHPTRPIVAYHLLWNHDVNGQWVPWAKATDAEIVWVGYDSITRAPTDLWTYWHGSILHADWRGRGYPAVMVQWGKHGNLPYGVIESTLPRPRKLNAFYAATFILLPDIWLGKLSHGGPWGFFHGYARYREFTRVVPLAPRLDAIVRSEDPKPALRAVFGDKHADKQHWPM